MIKSILKQIMQNLVFNFNKEMSQSKIKHIEKSRLPKIGIVTWFKSGNFGTNLQAIALYHHISAKMDCGFIQYVDFQKLFSNSLKIRFLYNCKCFTKKILSPVVLFRFAINTGNVIKGLKIAMLFKHFNIARIRKPIQLQEFDVFITGSDQIWNPYYLNPFYLLDFVPDGIPRLSYSSSLGVAEIPAEQREIYIQNLRKFKSIAIREKTGELLLKKLLNQDNIRTVMDPVFLLSAKEWKETLSISNKVEEYIFCYFVGRANDNKFAINKIQESTGIKKVIYIPAREYLDIKLDGICNSSAGVEDFVSCLANASLVCTDSFHATAFSLIFNRQFIEFKRFRDEDIKSQNSRITDILSHYGLENRLYKEGFDFRPIDYQKVNCILQQDIEDSKNYLDTVLAGVVHE